MFKKENTRIMKNPFFTTRKKATSAPKSAPKKQKLRNKIGKSCGMKMVKVAEYFE